MGSSREQGELWGRQARDWTELQEPGHKPLWQAMLESAGVGNGSSVLDVGCGGGGASILASAFGARVSGIDAAPELVALAAEREPTGEYRVGEMENLPYEDDRFDAVFAANAVQYAEDRVAAVRELKRVCTPGGRIVAALFGPPEKVEFRAVFQAVRDAMPEPPPGAGPFELSAPSVLEGLFQEAGLQVIGTGEVDCPFRYPNLETFWRAAASGGPFQGALGVVGEKKLKAVVEAAVAPFLLEDGSILIQPNMFRYVVAQV